MIEKIIKHITKEIVKTNTQITGCNNHKVENFSFKRYKKYSRDNLIRALNYKHMILKQQRRH